MNESLDYTTILHGPRRKMGISTNEYCLCDKVFRLQSNPESETPGWAYASRAYYADFLDISTRAIIDMIDRLCRKGLLERRGERGLIRTSRAWYEMVVAPVKKLHLNEDDEVKKLHLASEETSLIGMKKLHLASEETSHKNKRENKNENESENITVEEADPSSKPKGKKEKKAPQIAAAPPEVEQAVGYLNQLAGTKFRADSKPTISHVKARLSEGYTVADFELVIAHKVKAWGGDARMREYLRPETLFGSKFDSYLNAANVALQNQDKDNQQNGKYSFNANEAIRRGAALAERMRAERAERTARAAGSAN